VISDNQATGGVAAQRRQRRPGHWRRLFFVAGGSVCLDSFTVANIFGNTASMSDNDVFVVFTIC
jgi:hypothetical protein